ncbi:MAG: universal stress protein [Steroidobacteraceae bacterium]
METIRNILVLMEPQGDAQPAFDAALELARRHDARLELLLVDYQDLHVASFTPATVSLQEFHDSVMAGHQAMLERHVQRAASAGVVALAEALWGTPFHEVVLARVAATRPGLVVKHSVYHNPIERTLFTGSDWHLIRECPAPLLLVKDAGRLAGRPVLVCVDPLHSHDKPAALDHQLLERAVMLAGRLDGELHALHVFSIPAPVTVVGDAYIAAAALPAMDRTPVQVDKVFRDLLSAHGVPPSRGHLRVGAPARDVVAEAKALDAGLVVMGAVSRRRLERWFVGSTAESVLDRLPCNVWIEKPPAA